MKAMQNQTMRLKTLFSLILSFVLVNSSANFQSQKKYIFYLHGRIIEIQGKNAISPEYGKYEFDDIVKALKVNNSEVIAEVRNENVDNLKYAIKISKQIDSLTKLGVLPKNITVIGASKGAIIASNISSLNNSPINYVFLGGNNDYQEKHNNWKFHGNVLCFYDNSDTIAGKNYNYWKEKTDCTTQFVQIKINKKLGHGFLYKPYSEWIVPTKKWILNQKL